MRQNGILIPNETEALEPAKKLRAAARVHEHLLENGIQNEIVGSGGDKIIIAVDGGRVPSCLQEYSWHGFDLEFEFLFKEDIRMVSAYQDFHVVKANGEVSVPPKQREGLLRLLRAIKASGTKQEEVLRAIPRALVSKVDGEKCWLPLFSCRYIGVNTETEESAGWGVQLDLQTERLDDGHELDYGILSDAAILKTSIGDFPVSTEDCVWDIDGEFDDFEGNSLIFDGVTVSPKSLNRLKDGFLLDPTGEVAPMPFIETPIVYYEGELGKFETCVAVLARIQKGQENSVVNALNRGCRKTYYLRSDDSEFDGEVLHMPVFRWGDMPQTHAQENLIFQNKSTIRIVGDVVICKFYLPNGIFDKGLQ